MQKKFDIVVGLTGNPNVGKSTLFNTLTGSHQHVGNWPGKTVEKKQGAFIYSGKRIQLVDLPGAYSLTAYSEEETITADYIIEKRPNVVVQIVDAQNLERNLLLTIQLIELGAPLIVALNMVDIIGHKGHNINTTVLSNLLNVPVVIIDARQKKTLDDLRRAILRVAAHKQTPEKIKLSYGNDIDRALRTIKQFINEHESSLSVKEKHWLALKLIEGDYRAKQKITRQEYYLELKALAEDAITRLNTLCNRDVNTIVTRARYGFIKGVVEEAMGKHALSYHEKFFDKFDHLVMNKFLGIPFFVLVTWVMFQSTFILSQPLMHWIDSFFIWIGGQLHIVLHTLQAPAWLSSLLVDGFVGGVGGILVFIPIIGILFLFLALLEDSGYMARVAYVMDKLMHRIGLHGKAFIPLVLGFGCNVAGIMATRTLVTKKDRLLTILLNPFMSCGARLPVYALFAGAFFSAHQGWVIFSLYFLGILVAIVMGLIFKKYLLPGLSSPFTIELPPYRWPALRGVLIHAWERVWLFIKKAGTIILIFSIIVWFLASVPFSVSYGSRDSLAGSLGQSIAPAFKPLGFDNWQSAVALMFGFVAKEVIVSSFATLYGVGDLQSNTDDNALDTSLQDHFMPLSAYSFMVFVLLYMPCMAVIATVKRETNSWKWPLFMVFYTCAIAWVVSFIIYQGGKLLSLV